MISYILNSCILLKKLSFEIRRLYKNFFYIIQFFKSFFCYNVLKHELYKTSYIFTIYNGNTIIQYYHPTYKERYKIYKNIKLMYLILNLKLN